MSTAEGARRSPIYLQVAERIREAIIAGHLRPGDALPTERELAESLGVSRASVREALRALQAQGLVAASGPPARTVVVPGAGEHARDALVTLMRLNGVGVADLMRFRALLEGEAVDIAAGNPGDPWLDEADAALTDMRRPDLTLAEFDEADVRFHLALVRASGNEAMSLVMQALRGAVALHLATHLESQDDLPATLARLTAEHESILGAVRAGAGDDARTLIRSHISAFYADASDSMAADPA